MIPLRSTRPSRRRRALVALAMVVAVGAFVDPAGAAEGVPTVEVRGRSIPLDGRPLPDDLTVAERRQVFTAAGQALSGATARPPVGGEGPDWMPAAGVFELWCTQSNPGYGGCAGHHDKPAMDIGMPVGTPVLAAGPGLVAAADHNGGGRGTHVDLLHPDGSSSHYYHLSALDVAPGQPVERGQLLGRSGSTGSSTAPHLHYEEHGPDGQNRPIGPMLGQVGDQTVTYPQGLFGVDWANVPYGTMLGNDGYRPPVPGDLDRDGRPDRASGVLESALSAAGTFAA